MKRILCLTLLLLGGMTQANPLDDIVDSLASICGAKVPPKILDEIGGASVQQALCQIHAMAERGQGLIAAADAGTEQFIRQAFRDGFDLLGTYTDLDTDLASIENFANDIDKLIKDGVSLEGALSFITRTAAAERIGELLTKSTAKRGSLQYTVEENRRLNPLVLSKEIQSVETTAQTQEKAGEVLDVANSAVSQAVNSLTRGDEAELMLNVVDPLPTNQGIAEKAQEQGEKAVSTRAAVQVLLDFQTKALVQETSMDATTLAQLKENGLIEAQSGKIMSYVARELYAQRLAAANEWRNENRKTIEEVHAKASEAAGAFGNAGRMLTSSASFMGKKE